MAAGTMVDWLAAVISVLVCVPQIRRLRRGGASGISATSLGLTLASSAGWAGYALVEHMAALTICSALSLVLRLVVAHRMSPGSVCPRPVALVALGMVSVDAAAGLLLGAVAAGAVLVAQGLVQYLPQAITAWRVSDVSGVSPNSQRLQAMSGVAWGLSGLVHGDAALMAWSVSTTGSSGSVLLRLRGGCRPDQPAAPEAW